MTAEIILFVPGLKPGGETRTIYQVLNPEDAKKLADKTDTSPCEYVAPEDCA